MTSLKDEKETSYQEKQQWFYLKTNQVSRPETPSSLATKDLKPMNVLGKLNFCYRSASVKWQWSTLLSHYQGAAIQAMAGRGRKAWWLPWSWSFRGNLAQILTRQVTEPGFHIGSEDKGSMWRHADLGKGQGWWHKPVRCISVVWVTELSPKNAPTVTLCLANRKSYMC